MSRMTMEVVILIKVFDINFQRNMLINADHIVQMSDFGFSNAKAPGTEIELSTGKSIRVTDSIETIRHQITMASRQLNQWRNHVITGEE